MVSRLQPTISLNTLIHLKNKQQYLDSIESRSTKSIATHFKPGMENEKGVKTPAHSGLPGPPDAAFRSSMLNQAKFASAKVQLKKDEVSANSGFVHL